MFFMVINFGEFYESTTVTGIESITSSLTKVYFPSVIVCNINQVMVIWYYDIHQIWCPGGKAK